MNQKRIPTIAVLLPLFDQGYFRQVTQGILSASKKHNVNTRFFLGNFISERVLENEQNLAYYFPDKSNCDGIILFAGTFGNYTKQLKSYFSEIPLVSIGKKLSDCSSVMSDNKSGMHELMHHLIIDHKYKRICFVKGPEDNIEANERFDAYRESLEKFKIKYDPTIVLDGNFRWDVAQVYGHKLIKNRKAIVDAIVAANDDMALGFFSFFRELNISIPEDIALCGFDNVNQAKFTFPPLTTIHQPFYEQGEKSIELLLQTMSGEKPIESVLPTKLVIRQSCDCNNIYKIIRSNKTKKQEVDAKNQNVEKTPIKIISSKIDLWADNIANSVSLRKEDIDKYKTCLISAIKNNFNGADLLLYLKEKIFHDKSSDEIIDLWNKIVTDSFSILSDTIKEETQLEGLFKLRRMSLELIDQTGLLILGNRQNSTYQNAWIFRNLLEQLSSSRNYTDLLDTIITGFKYVGLSKFYMVLYDKNNIISEESLTDLTAHLELGYNGSEIVKIEDPQSYPVKQILPDKYLNFIQNDSYVCKALVKKSKHYGLVLFGYDSERSLYIDAISDRLSSVLDMIDQFNEVENIVTVRTKELRSANEKLQELDDLKNDFIANITHDFRSPLMVILNMSDQSIKYEHTNEQLVNNFKVISQSGIKLKGTIDNLLELAKMDSGGVQLQVQKIDINDYCRSLENYYFSFTSQMNIDFILDVPESFEGELYSDKVKLDQIVNNIISNAIKFLAGQKGIIRLKVEDSSESITFSIEDNGPGIDKKNLKTIFERFAQTENGRSSIIKGTGIGLAFSKELIGYLHGELWAESDGLDKGATFIIKLFKGKQIFKESDFVDSGFKSIEVNRKELKSKIKTDYSLLKEDAGFSIHFNNYNSGVSNYDHLNSVILIVDDDNNIRTILHRYLKFAGYQNVILAGDGYEALNACSKYVPDLIISDVNMPRLDGIDFHNMFIQKSGMELIPFIFLSAVNDKNLILKRKEAGAVEFLSKPIEEKEFIVSVETGLKKYLAYKKTLLQANIDELTGINNKRSFQNHIKKELLSENLEDLSIIFFDIDHFKNFNDTYGHQLGDEVLRLIGKVLETQLNTTDFPVRFGGEEFLVILPNTNITGARVACEKLRNSIISKSIFHKEEELKVTASFGICSLTSVIIRLTDSSDVPSNRLLISEKIDTVIDLLIEFSDSAMYKAKRTLCNDCGFSSEKSNDFSNNKCNKCKSSNIEIGRDRIKEY